MIGPVDLERAEGVVGLLLMGCGEVRQDVRDMMAELFARQAYLEQLLNTPELEDFARGAVLEAAHQVDRFGVDHDAGKTAWDWFWLIGFLAQKAAAAAVAGDTDKARHHTISTAAALANWHRQLSGGEARMRPGIARPFGDPDTIDTRNLGPSGGANLV